MWATAKGEVMRTPRDLATTLPSPSEMDNFHKCPCFWVMKDRLWVKGKGERWPLTFGKIVDEVCEQWLRKEVTTTTELIKVFWEKTNAVAPEVEDEYFETYAASTKDALEAWAVKYGAIVQKEEIVEIQPKILGETKVKIDYVVRTEAGLRIRERKLLTGWADVDDEMAKYEMGHQPLCYYEIGKQHYKEHIECVEFEFLVRSIPAKGKYKATPADAMRREIFVDGWKTDIWYNTAQYTNHCMLVLEDALFAEGAIANFASIPRFTRNCLQKIGKKVYECDFYKACKNNTNPLRMEEHFTCDREEVANGIEALAEGDSASGEDSTIVS